MDWGDEMDAAKNAVFQVNIQLSHQDLILLQQAFSFMDAYVLEGTDVSEARDAFRDLVQLLMDGERAAVIKVDRLSEGPKQAWEGMRCATPGCTHSSNLHAKQKGLCVAESCACMSFSPSGKML